VDAKNGAFEDTADEKSFVSLLATDGDGELSRCLVDGQAFYDWQERLMEALQK